VEVHHIVPEANGGKNDIENAIALCFDCHSAAGHYNPRHPRGTKFSPDELRLHKAQWHGMVSDNKISTDTNEDAFLCRYFICKSYEGILELCEPDLTNFPLENSILHPNAVWEFQIMLTGLHPAQSRYREIYGDCYSTIEAFKEKFPQVGVTDKSSSDYPAFESVRVPSEDEFTDRISSKDGISRFLFDSGLTVEQITRAVVREDACGGCHSQEVYLLRQLWCVYLAITNISDTHLRPTEVEAIIEDGKKHPVRSFELAPRGRKESIAFPKVSVEPGATIVVPVATIAGSLAGLRIVDWSNDMTELKTGQVQELSFSTLDKSSTGAFTSLGPTICPLSLSFQQDGINSPQAIHKLDLENVYILNRFWEKGSCPHLFFFDGSRKRLTYWSELFSEFPCRSVTHVITVPCSFSSMLIVELEFEETYIELISIDGVPKRRGEHLKRWDFIEVPVQPGQEISITGWYTPSHHSNNLETSPGVKNDFLASFMTCFSFQSQSNV